MNKQALVRDIKDYVGNSMPTISEVARYLGVGRDKARAMLEGLDYYPSGRAKKYFVGDVADRIMQSRGM